MRHAGGAVVLAVVLAGMPAAGTGVAGAQQGSGNVPDAPGASGVPSAPAPQGSSGSSGVPDAPGAGQGGASDNLKDLTRGVAPGKSTTAEETTPPAEAAAPTGPPAAQDGPPQQETPELSGPLFKLPPVRVNFVTVPVTVLDSHHQQVAGLTFRDFRIYENGQRQHISYFSVDPVPLSVALVIDQSLPKDTMAKVNQSLSALQGALAPFDEVAVFTYANGVTEQTDFTAAQGNRLPAVLEHSKAAGTEMGVPVNSGPLAQGPLINNKPVDPNLTPGRSSTGFITIPRETHTLSDAILEAGNSLANREKGRRRVIYVVSDGKDARSKASVREVIRYLQTNQETVYATMVGDAATWGLGYLDRVHLPLIPAENVLPRYTVATGGVLESQFSTEGIERSFASIAEKVRTQYTLGFYSHIPVLDGKYRQIVVNVERPNLDVIAKRGYYPTANALQH